MTFDAGRIITWRLPRFSAFDMFLRQSASTETFTMIAVGRRTRTAGCSGCQSGGVGEKSLLGTYSERSSTLRRTDGDTQGALPPPFVPQPALLSLTEL